MPRLVEGCMAKEKNQSDRFKEAAKEAETDQSEEAFEARLKRIAEQKPKKEEPAK